MKPPKIRVHISNASKFLSWVKACLLTYDPKFKEVLTGITFAVCKKDKGYRVFTLAKKKVGKEQRTIRPHREVKWDAILEFHVQ